MKTKKYFVPKGREKFLSTVLNRDGLNHYFEETEGRSYVWVCLSCKEYRIMLEDAECEYERSLHKSNAPIYSYHTLMQTIKEDLLSEDSLDQLTDYFLDQEWKDPYFLYFQIPEGIKAAAYKFDHKHNWKKGALVCEEYIVVIKKKPDYLFSGNWGIASIYPFPTGLIWF